MLCDVILRQLTVTPGKEILSLFMREFCFVTSVISESPQEPSLGSSSRSSSNSTRALDFPTIGTLFQQYILPAASAEEYTMHGLIRDILHTVLNFAGNGLENLIPVHRNPWQIFQLKIRYYNAQEEAIVRVRIHCWLEHPQQDRIKPFEKFSKRS